MSGILRQKATPGGCHSKLLSRIRPLLWARMYASAAKDAKDKITKGLLDKYGPQRVVDTPITEAAVILAKEGVNAGADYLVAPVERIAEADVPLPYAANLNRMALPQIGDERLMMAFMQLQ